MKMEWRRLFFRIDLWLLAVLLLIVNIALFSMQEKELWQETAGEYGVGVEAVQEEYRTQLEAYRGMDLQEAWADCSEKIRQSSMAVEWNMSDSVRSIWIAPLLEHLSGYEAYLQQIRNNAEMFGQISIFSEEDSFAVRNIKKTSQDFDRLSDVKIKTGEYSAVAEIASSHAADWLILVAGIAFLFLMMEERTLGLCGLIRVSSCGRGELFGKRLLALFCYNGVLVLAFYGSEWISRTGFTDRQHWMRPFSRFRCLANFRRM